MSGILVTGAAGFLGSHLSQRLLDRGDEVVGVDDFNDYYDPSLKQARADGLRINHGFRFFEGDIADRSFMTELFRSQRPENVVHLAAQAGVRHSLVDPYVYIQSNLVGFANVLEGCRRVEVEHLVYASSSSVYGANSALPYSEKQPVGHPVSLYSASKRANELMAHSYAHLFSIPCTGLRYFTVYGPWGRPDMAYYRFAQSILEGRTIQLYNRGRMSRDFTFIDDAVEATIRILDKPAAPDPDWSSDRPDLATGSAPFRVYNVGTGRTVTLHEFVQALEKALGCKAKIEPMPMQPGDVRATRADVERLMRDFDYRPQVPIEEGLQRFADWFKQHHPELAPNDRQ